jgi:single-strand selective monofunctional uracil DNA glycosylase
MQESMRVRIKQCAPPGAQVGDIMHPSPANPKANKDWDKLIEAQLRALGVDI